MGFHWNLNESKSSQVSRTLLSILADLSNAEVWMISIRSPFSRPFMKPFEIVPSTPIIIRITVSFIFHNLQGFTTCPSFRFH